MGSNKIDGIFEQSRAFRPRKMYERIGNIKFPPEPLLLLGIGGCIDLGFSDAENLLPSLRWREALKSRDFRLLADRPCKSSNVNFEVSAWKRIESLQHLKPSFQSEPRVFPHAESGQDIMGRGWIGRLRCSRSVEIEQKHAESPKNGGPGGGEPQRTEALPGRMRAKCARPFFGLTANQTAFRLSAIRLRSQ